jgi:signal transduction histidine kinase
VSVAGVAAFTYFCVPPRYSFDPGTSERWSVLVALLVSSLAVGQLASRVQREAGRSARLAEEQAALRRVATLVARGVPQDELFGAVTEEVGRLLATDLAGMIRFEPDDTVTPVAAWAAAGDHPPLPRHWPVDEGDAAALIATALRPTRVEDWSDVRGPIAAFIKDVGVRSSVANPILVEGRLWGALAVHTTDAQPLPADAETRLENFTELVATAIANVEARDEVHRLADEQAALRRVATLVAREVPPAQVFAAVADEVSRLLGVDYTGVFRYDEGKPLTAVAHSDEPGFPVPPGTRRPLEGDNVADVPILVQGTLWGVIVASSRERRLPPDAAERIGHFTELVATAVSNAEARREIAASRARIVAATDDERRRVVRDLHDGAQQRLVHTIITLKLAARALQGEDERLPELMAEALGQAERANVELRELAHGILPAALTQGGLRAGVQALASRMPLPVDNGVAVGALPDTVAATAYFVVAEALTNVAKHARAQRAAVTAQIDDGTLAVQVRDDGIGGALPEGTGLVGLADRLAVLGGELRVESPPDGGTVVEAAIPLPD